MTTPPLSFALYARMQELLNNLGINWKLLLSQAVNFGVLLIILRIFAYKPLLTFLHERRDRIAEGLTKADEADRRLDEANHMAQVKMKEAEAAGMQMLKKTEDDAKVLEAKLVAQAQAKETQMMQDAEMKAQEKVRAAEDAFRKEASALVRAAIVKTVEMSPDAVDAALVDKAVKELGMKS